MVQAYVTSTAALPDGVDRPVRWLAGFARVTAAPGETVTATVLSLAARSRCGTTARGCCPPATTRSSLGDRSATRGSRSPTISPVAGEENGSGWGGVRPD